MEPVDQGQPTVRLRGGTSEHSTLIPQGPTPILHQSVHRIAYHDRGPIVFVRQFGVKIGCRYMRLVRAAGYVLCQSMAESSALGNRTSQVLQIDVVEHRTAADRMCPFVSQRQRAEEGLCHTRPHDHL